METNCIGIPFVSCDKCLMNWNVMNTWSSAHKRVHFKSGPCVVDEFIAKSSEILIARFKRCKCSLESVGAEAIDFRPNLAISILLWIQSIYVGHRLLTVFTLSNTWTLDDDAIACVTLFKRWKMVAFVSWAFHRNRCEKENERKNHIYEEHKFEPHLDSTNLSAFSTPTVMKKC